MSIYGIKPLEILQARTVFYIIIDIPYKDWIRGWDMIVHGLYLYNYGMTYCVL